MKNSKQNDLILTLLLGVVAQLPEEDQQVIRDVRRELNKVVNGYTCNKRTEHLVSIAVGIVAAEVDEKQGN